MAKTRSAGDLYESVAFDRRAETHDPDDDGNTLGEWVEQFRCRAGYIHLRGGENVVASRLQGEHPQVIFVRASRQARAVTPDWRVRDVRTGIAFNIRDISPTADRAWLDFLCQSGVADG